jgi:hypothetical protein
MNRSGPLIDEILQILEQKDEGEAAAPTSHERALAALQAALLGARRERPSGPHLSAEETAALAGGIHDAASARHASTCLRCLKEILFVRDEMQHDDSGTAPVDFIQRIRAVLDGSATSPLKVAASSSIWNPGIMGCMLLDSARGSGHIGLVEVRLDKRRSRAGKARVSKNLREVQDAVDRACRLAAAYAHRWLNPFDPLPRPGGCLVTLAPPSLSVAAGMGKSLHLPIALAAIGAHFIWASRGTAASGALRGDGTFTLEPAGGIGAKIAALAQDPRFDKVIVPEECRGEAKCGRRRLGVMGARDLDEAVVSLFPVRRLYVRCGKAYAHPPSIQGLPCGWSTCSLIDLPPALGPSSLVHAVRRVMSGVHSSSRHGNLTQLLIAGPVGLGAALGVAMAQRALGARGPVLFVQPPTPKGPGGAWCDLEAFPSLVLRTWEKK